MPQKRFKIFDTKEAADIIKARATLALARDDFRGLVRQAKLNANTAKFAMDFYESALQSNIEGDGVCASDLRTKVGEDFYEMWLYDAIDPDFGIGAKQVIDAANEAADKSLPIKAYLNSPGGYVDEGRAIATTLARHARQMGGRGVSVVDGLAASAATTIALGSPQVEMAPGTQFMIHRSWGGFQGGYDDADAFKEMMDKTDRNIAGDYVRKTGKDIDEVLDMMTKETWLNVDEAIDMKFADSIHGDVEQQSEEIEIPVASDTQNSDEFNPRAAFAQLVRRI